MRHLQLTQAVSSSYIVRSEHFGGNALKRRNTDNGTPTEDFETATIALDLPILRYPAGEGDVVYADGLMFGDQLPEHLINFLEASRAAGQKVLIVTPTHASYTGPEDLNSFVKAIMYDYDDVVHAFEVGNEYWQHQTETSYGQVANESVLAIDQALAETGFDRPIWVQMGDAGGFASEFHSSKDDRWWTTRNEDANQQILDQLSTEARDVIDGAVEHYYFRDGSQYLAPEFNDQLIWRDHQIWKNALGADLTLNITEWNIRTTNYDQLGMRAASTLVAQFSYLLELDVDEAYVWPPQHNTSSDLAGGNEVIRDPATGIVINSVGGAAFDMMSSSLVGLEYRPSSVTADSSDITHTVYANDERAVVYLASRSNNVEEVAFSLGTILGSSKLTSATLVGYDKSTSDGLYFNYTTDDWATADYVWVDGEKYFYNEHDVRAQITQLDVQTDHNDTFFDVTLRPYEVVELTYQLFNSIGGSSSNDQIEGTIRADLAELGAGNDTISSDRGNDTVHGGSGNDFVNSGPGADSVLGGDGADTLHGFGGADTLYGGSGDDEIDGSNGNDHLTGGSGDDLMMGGSGNDTIHGGEGANLLLGDSGADTFILEPDLRYAADLVAFNATSAFQTGTGERINLEGLSKFEHVLDGGQGQDALIMTNQDDALILHDNFSRFHESITPERDAFGHFGTQRILNIEEISAGVGNDVIDLTSTDYSLASTSMTLAGDEGNDIIWGSDADDIIYGGMGNDVLFGGAGVNHLVGGAGADTFQFTASSLDTTVDDFNFNDGDIVQIFETEDFELISWGQVGRTVSFFFDDGQISVTLAEVGDFEDQHLQLLG